MFIYCTYFCTYLYTNNELSIMFARLADAGDDGDGGNVERRLSFSARSSASIIAGGGGDAC